VTTTKLPSGRQPRTLAPAHLALAVIMAAALGIGYALKGPIQPPLLGLALGFMGVSFALAWTEAWSFPPPFDPTLLTRRRREMGDLLPDAPPSPDIATEPSAQGAR
jgi:hypothetical protein